MSGPGDISKYDILKHMFLFRFLLVHKQTSTSDLLFTIFYQHQTSTSVLIHATFTTVDSF